ncbi:MAG: hypothetical protein IJQ34_09715 [Kiritimatiellae bacterium]|nr:hypothetical protein [Kiritimatiellia bacterium]
MMRQKLSRKLTRKSQPRAGIGMLLDNPRGGVRKAAGQVVLLGIGWHHPQSHLLEWSIKTVKTKAETMKTARGK